MPRSEPQPRHLFLLHEHGTRVRARPLEGGQLLIAHGHHFYLIEVEIRAIRGGNLPFFCERLR